MNTPPAFTALHAHLLPEVMTKEIAARASHAKLPHRALANKMMVRVTLPPLAMWAVLYACVEYFM
jgi:hypothetical protein